MRAFTKAQLAKYRKACKTYVPTSFCIDRLHSAAIDLANAVDYDDRMERKAKRAAKARP